MIWVIATFTLTTCLLYILFRNFRNHRPQLYKNCKISMSPFFILIAFAALLVFSTAITYLIISMKIPVLILLLLDIGLMPLDEISSVIESIIIAIYHPRIYSEKDISPINCANWDSVSFLSISSLIRQFTNKKIAYVGSISVPALKMTVPLASTTNDPIYHFGAGMLEPRLIDKTAPLVVGAHNLGSGSRCLFSPLAQNYLYLLGQTVLVSNFAVVKEFTIQFVKIIGAYDVSSAFDGQSNSLTLLTCTNDNQFRILIRAKLVKKYPYHLASQSIKGLIKTKNMILNV